MGYLVDTNVLSELRKGTHADTLVQQWQSGRRSSDLWLSVLTLMEIKNGIEQVRRKDSLFADKLDRWYAEHLLSEFSGRILEVNLPICELRASFPSERTLPNLDALIAATAKYHGLTIVTRNTKDFEGLGIELLNPWEAASE